MGHQEHLWRQRTDPERGRRRLAPVRCHRGVHRDVRWRGHASRPDESDALMDRRQRKAVFQNYLVPTLQNGFWSAPQTWNDPAVIRSWWNGAYPLYFMGSWITSGFVPNPANLKVFSLPGGGSNQGIVFAADYFFVPKYAAHSDLGKRLAQWLSTKEAQTIQVGVGGHIATATGVSASAYPALDAQVASLMQGKAVLTDLDDTIGN